MAMSGEFFSRDELLGGLPARRASTLLFTIESRTAQLSSQFQQSLAYDLNETSAKARENAFLEALAAGRDLPTPPTIQDIEQFAPDWSYLVPEDIRVRAAVAHLLGQKYEFPEETIPGIRAALGLDDDQVKHAYQKLYKQPITSIYIAETRLLDNFRWGWAKISGWFNGLPPFWMAFVLTLVVGAVTLAVPIAVAGIGPIPGVVLIVLVGVINMITIAAMAETVSRTGNIRFGNAFIGRVIADYLGEASSAIASLVLTGFSFGLLLIFYLGISGTLADATGIPRTIVIIFLFLVGIYFLTRGSLNATVGVSFILTGINLILLLVMAGLALTQFKIENFLYTNLPFGEGKSFEPELLATLMGVVLGLYSAHVMVAVFGKMLLTRDPSGKSVMRGHLAGIGFATLLNSIWVVAINGAISPEILQNETGTVLGPLANQIGPVVHILGTLFVVLSMGLGVIHFSISLFNLMRERLPAAENFPLGKPAHFVASLTPIILVFLVAEWMIISGKGSFAGILGFLGVSVDSLLAGVFPVLLVVASRRKGELIPGGVLRFLGNPILVITIYLLFLGNILFHSGFIWENTFQKVGGLLLAGLVIIATALIFKRKSFAPRMIIEIRDDRSQPGDAFISVTAAGKPVSILLALINTQGERIESQESLISLPNFSALRKILTKNSDSFAKELKIWAHRITTEENYEGIQSKITINQPSSQTSYDLTQNTDQLMVPIQEPFDLEIEFQEDQE